MSKASQRVRLASRGSVAVWIGAEILSLWFLVKAGEPGPGDVGFVDQIRWFIYSGAFGVTSLLAVSLQFTTNRVVPYRYGVTALIVSLLTLAAVGLRWILIG